MMKKILLLFILGAFLFSCGSTKMEREKMRSVKGDWILTEISYPSSSGFVDVRLFQDASAKCFRNSTWNFVSNNNQGRYQLNGTDCDGQKQEFTWNIMADENNPSEYYFTLKPVGEDENSREVERGFRMELMQMSENKMTWRQNIQHQGEPFIIQMNFSKKY